MLTGHLSNFTGELQYPPLSVGPRDTATYDWRVQLEQDYAPGTIAFATNQAPLVPPDSTESEKDCPPSYDHI
jgi:hypothetical protein